MAEELLASDALCMANGERVVIRSISTAWFSERIGVYNFDVQDWHTYFASEIEVLVHNGACMPSSPTRLSKSFAKQLAKKYGYSSVELLKADFVTGSVAHWDPVKNTATGIIWLVNKTNNVFRNTGLTLK